MSSSFSRALALSLTVAVFAARPVLARQAVPLSGLVSNPTGAPVADVSIELSAGPSDAAVTTVTDDRGRYRLVDLEPGDYTLRATKPGFRASQQSVRVASEPVEVEVRLAMSSLRESIDVTEDWTRAEVESRRASTPGGVTIVDGADLSRRHTNGLADMLRFVPGVWAESSSGSEELFFSSRGSNLDAVHYDKNGLKLLQDGLPVTTADGNNHNRIVDPLSARYASVARGANAMTYGASTLGGAIDFVSPTARNTAPLSLFANGGSHGSLEGRVTAGRRTDALDGLLTLETKQWSGYRDHSDQDRIGLYANAGWQPSDAVIVRAFATWVDNDQLLPGALTRAEADADPGQASAAAIGGAYGKVVETGRLATKATWTLGARSSLMAGISVEEQSLFHPIVDRIFVDFDGPGPNPPVEVFSLLVDTDHRDFGGVVRYEHAVGSHEILAGLHYGRGSVEGGNFRNAGGRPNGLSERVDNSAEGIEAFVMDHWRATDRLTLVFGAQVVDTDRDVRTTNASTGAVSNPRDRYSSFNPRLGAVVSLGDAGQLYGNVSRLFEAPTTFQMEDDVRGGDATLDPMTGTVAEVGWRSGTRGTRHAHWTWDVGAYWADLRDEILSVDDPNAPGNSLTTNVDATVHAGIEALVGASFALGGAHRVDSRVSASLNRFRFDDDPVLGDNDLPAAPDYVVRGEILYHHAKGFWVGPTFDLVGERFVDFANSTSVDSHVLMGLRGGFSASRFEVFGEVRNLFDEDHAAAVNVLDVAGSDARVIYPGGPLSAYVGMKVSLGR